MRSSLPLAIASLALLGALGCLPEPEPTRYFDIVGTVRAAADNAPVAGALVRLTAPGSIVEPGETLGEATTDAAGNYQLGAPLPRGYAIIGDASQGVDCSVVALHATKAGFAVGPDQDGAAVQCTRSRQRVDVLMPAE